ncbi:MAG: alpha-2-macroglobulin, partial [Thermoguttaceae bacterium]
MKTILLIALPALAGLLCGAAALAVEPNREAKDYQALRQRYHELVAQGNFNDAYQGLRTLLLDKAVPGADEDLADAVNCLQRLNRMAEIDEMLEAAVTTHQHDPHRWAFLWAIARQYQQIQHQGFVVAGKFYRGPHRGGDGRYVFSGARDRVRALQLMVQALSNARKDDNHPHVSLFLLSLADMLANMQQPWRLQAKTDLDVLPDYEEGWGYYGGQPQGAPVDAAGRPVYYTVPKSFEAATSDGQRWRWCLQQAVEFDAAQTNTARMRLADFLHGQFGVQTMANYGWFFGRAVTDDSKED